MQLLTLCFFVIFHSVSSFRLASVLAPFYEPHPLEPNFLSNLTFVPPESELRKRSGNCPVNYESCSTLAAGYGGACCSSGSLCTTDGAHQVACCSIGAKCTGRLDVPTSTTQGVSGSSSAISTATNTNPTPTMTGSVVDNAYFPFPYSPTSYSDHAACLSALSSCQSNYAACAANLQGTSYGVTIIAPAGGITVSPTVQNLGMSSATSICSSLSSQACHNIASNNCNQFETGVATNAVAKPTIGSLATAGIVVGMGWEFARQFI